MNTPLPGVTLPIAVKSPEVTTVEAPIVPPSQVEVVIERLDATPAAEIFQVDESIVIVSPLSPIVTIPLKSAVEFVVNVVNVAAAAVLPPIVTPSNDEVERSPYIVPDTYTLFQALPYEPRSYVLLTQG